MLLEQINEVATSTVLAAALVKFEDLKEQVSTTATGHSQCNFQSSSEFVIEVYRMDTSSFGSLFYSPSPELEAARRIFSCSAIRAACALSSVARATVPCRELSPYTLRASPRTFSATSHTVRTTSICL